MSVLWIRNCTLQAAAAFGRVFCRAIRGGAATALYADIEGRARAKREALVATVSSGPARQFFLRLDRREIVCQVSDISGDRQHSYRLERCLLGNGVRAA